MNSGIDEQWYRLLCRKPNNLLALLQTLLILDQFLVIFMEKELKVSNPYTAFGIADP